MGSRIENVITEIEEYIDSCKFQPLSSTKIIVNKEEMEELLTELRLKMPEEIKRFQKMISNKEAILAKAQAEADEIVARAQVETNELVNEHQIMQQAYEQANEIVAVATKQAQEILDSATQDADNIRLGALNYTDQMMQETENILRTALTEGQTQYESLMMSLKKNYDTVVANRQELIPEEQSPVSQQTETKGDSSEQEDLSDE
ncbi:MAG: ATPase [Lachnospiraceae bacterium]